MRRLDGVLHITANGGVTTCTHEGRSTMDTVSISAVHNPRPKEPSLIGHTASVSNAEIGSTAREYDNRVSRIPQCLLSNVRGVIEVVFTHPPLELSLTVLNELAVRFTEPTRLRFRPIFSHLLPFCRNDGRGRHAGARPTYPRLQPWPSELNRAVTARTQAAP